MTYSPYTQKIPRFETTRRPSLRVSTASVLIPTPDKRSCCFRKGIWCKKGVAESTFKLLSLEFTSCQNKSGKQFLLYLLPWGCLKSNREICCLSAVFSCPDTQEVHTLEGNFYSDLQWKVKARLVCFLLEVFDAFIL